MNFTLRQLQYAVAVAELRSFRGAAQRCHVSQPALSAQIRQLEEVLGVRLFERDRRHVWVTSAGQDIVARARALLASAADLEAAAQGAQQGLAGTLRLGVIPTVAPYALPALLPAMRAHYPQLRAVLREDRTNHLVEAVQQTELDVLLLAREAELGSLQTAVVADDPFLLAVPRSHRLASRKRVRESELTADELLVLEDGHCLGDQALAACGMSRAGRSDDLRATSLGTLVQMVAQELGVTLIPEVAVRAARRGAELSIIPFARSGPRRTIVLAWRASSPFAEAYRQLAADMASWWPQAG